MYVLHQICQKDELLHFYYIKSKFSSNFAENGCQLTMYQLTKYFETKVNSQEMQAFVCNYFLKISLNLCIKIPLQYTYRKEACFIQPIFL